MNLFHSHKTSSIPVENPGFKTWFEFKVDQIHAFTDLFISSMFTSSSLLKAILLSLSVSIEAELSGSTLRVDRCEGRGVRDEVRVKGVVFLT